MTLGKRIKKARLGSGLSQEELALAISQFGDGRTVSRTAIAQWETGTTKEIGAANLLKAAKILNVAPEWLQFGTGSKEPSLANTENSLPTNLGLKIVPILSYAQAFNHMEFDKTEVVYTGIDEILAAVTGPHVFALTIKEESMSPDLQLGDIVVIDPNIKPLPGEIVLAKLENESSILLRRYRPLQKEANGFFAFELVPINEFWPKITVTSKNPGHIIGTLIEHRCRRRLNPAKNTEDNISENTSVEITDDTN